MASNRIRGITIEIGGDTTKLQKSMQDVNSQLSKTQRALSDVNKLLKLDPGNAELLTQKQKYLAESIQNTEKRLNELKNVQRDSVSAEDWDTIQREIIETEQKLKNLEEEYKNFGSVAAQQVAVVGEQMQDIGGKISSVGDTLTKSVSVPIVGAFTAAGGGAIKFSDGLAKIGTIADTSVKDMGAFHDELLDLSNATGIGAGELAEATYQAISASVDTADAVGFVAQAADLARAGFLETGEAVDVLTTVINSYGYSAEDAGKISDMLVQTQNKGKTTVDQLAQSMGNIIPAAAALNVPFEQLNTSYAVMTRQGINTANATTYLDTMFRELADDGSTVSQILQEQTGQTFGQLMESGASLGDVLEILNESVDGDSEAFLNLWGQARAGRGALSIVNEGADAFNEELAEMENSTGNVSNALEALETPGEKARRALNHIVNVGIEIGDRLLPYVEKAADWLQKLGDKWDSLDESTQNTIITIAMVVAAIGPLLSIGGRLTSGIGSVLSFAPKIVTAIASIGGFIGGTLIPAILPILPIILGVAAAVAIVILVVKNLSKISEWASGVIHGATEKIGAAADWVKEKFQIVADFLSDVWNSISGWATETWSNITGTIQEAASAAWSTVTEKWEDLKTKTGEAWAGIKQRVQEYGSGIWGVLRTATQGMRTIWSGAFNAIDQITGGKLSAAVSTVTEKVNAIKQAFEDKLGAARDAVERIIEKIKGFFNFTWNLPKLSVPHFTITPVGWKVGDLLKGSIPKLDVSWYRRAYENPVLFNSPTVIPTAGGLKGFGDGNGGEIVMGMNKLRELVGQSLDPRTIYAAVKSGMQDADVRIYVGDREAGRILRGLGVQFGT